MARPNDFHAGAAIALVAAGLMNAGCGEGPATAVTPGPAPAAAPAPAPAPAAAPATLAGFLDDFSPSSKIIRGWAWDSSRPDEPVEVELFDGNNRLGTVKADILRQDLVKEKRGNGRHAFEFPVPDRLLDGKEHQIRAIFAGTGQALNHSPRTWRRTK